jgi:cytochrome c-type biogenesis protein CcsB
MIKVSDPSLKNLLGLKGKYASFNNFLDLNYGDYKIGDYVDASYKKKPAHRTGFEKDVIKVDERVNICYMIYSGSLFRIFPKPGDENNKWYAAEDAEIFDTTDVVFIRHILPLYYSTINEAIASGNWEEAGENLAYIKSYQKKYGEQIFPNLKKIRLEILYNNINVFKRLFPLYSLVGFILLILLLITTIRRSSGFRITIRILVILLGAAFVLHTAGLAARWYISGHAPWSNGYETMIYIAWAIMASGFIFMKRSRITLAVTSVLASLTLMVANMSWMDPEITNLVPVLKSYWLIIHVALITASYSFLAIGMILGFMVLVILSFANEKNYRKIKLTIEELTNINEMNLTIGVVFLTIGTFLGAVWANESWGRYWGWDPKETWALVSILVYSFVIHMRMVPGLRGSFALNFAALISFSAILMTYFGVNYYLSGLHSYASGDPVPIPSFVYYTIAIVAFVSIFAFLKERKFSKLTS